MAKKSPLEKDVAGFVRGLLDRRPDALASLDALSTKHAKKPAALKTALEDRATIGVAAMLGEVAVVERLLKTGVDPNAFPRFDMDFAGSFEYPLVLACRTSPEPEAEEGIVASIRALLDAGASVDTVGPPPERVRTDARYTALDVAIHAAAWSIVDLLMRHAAPVTREAALVAATLPSQGEAFERAWLLEYAKTAPIAASTRLGHVLHAALVRADEELWSILVARVSDLDITTSAEVRLDGGAFPQFGDGFYEPMTIPAGATLLDVAGLVRARLSGVAAQYEEARRSKKRPHPFQEKNEAALVAKLEALGRIEAGLRASGGVAGAPAPWPPVIAEVEAALLRLLAALGTADRWHRPPVDMDGRGPLGFLMAVAQHSAPLFAGASDGHLLGTLLKGELSRKPVLYGPDLEADLGRAEAEDMTAAGHALVIWPKQYPAAAKAALSTAILGETGGEVIAASREATGTTLWAITKTTVRPLGDVSSFVQQGVDALIASR